MRIRAFLYTVAYVSVRDTNFFDVQTALFMSEKVLNFVTQTFKNQVPPTAFYVQAWASTAHHLSEQVRISGSTLRDACLQTAGWEHRWTSWSPSPGFATSGNNNQNEKQNHGGGGQADVPKQILEDIQKAKAQAQRWQSEAMKIQNELNYYKNANGGGGNGGGNGGGKDKGKKGQGKQSGNKRNFNEVVDIRDDRRGDRGGDRRGDRR